MIKKAVLPLLTAPFLMVFSSFSFASYSYYHANAGYHSTPYGACAAYVDAMYGNSRLPSSVSGVSKYTSTRFYCNYSYNDRSEHTVIARRSCTGSGCLPDEYHQEVLNNPNLLPILNDEQCSSENGDQYSTYNVGVYNYLANGGTVRTNGGACSVSSSGGGVDGCAFGDDGSAQCILSIDSRSTGEYGQFGVGVPGGLDSSSNGTFSVVDFSGNDYLTELPGGCSDNSSCVAIGDKSYLVDWDSAPDYFEYVGSDGNTYSKPSSGGGSGGDTGGGDPTDPTNPTDPTDPGGNDGGDSGDDSGGSDGGNDSGDGSGGSSGGGSSGGGSTVPDFEFDESGIIEAIGSAGQSNRNAINALSNDVTSSINNQTNELNNATSAQTDALSGALSNQTDTLSNSLDSQTDTITGALNDQTGTLSGSLDALGTSIVDAINAFGSGEGESDGEGTEGDGLLDGISNLFNGLVDDLASRFTEDLGNGDDLFNSSSMDQTLDGLEEERQLYNEEVNTFMDEIGDGSSSGIADQVTTNLPSLPSGSCVPLQFGPIEISCRPFDLIKSWLTWIVYLWTVVSVVDTFFRSGQRTA